MGRPLRYVPPGRPLEVTNRAFQGRYLLLPRGKVRALVLGALGRAQRHYGMPIHTFTFASNHFHLLLSPRDAEHLADFMELFESKLAREMNRLYDWSGSLWDDRYHSIPIEADEETLVGRLRYILSHGVKENLVARAADWPGANCVRALTEGEPLRGTWYDRTALYEASRWGKKIDPEDFAEEEEVVLTPLPCWAHLPEKEVQYLVQSLIEEIEAEAAARHRARGTRPVGVRAVLAHHPHQRPKNLKRSPRPWFDAKTREGRALMREAYRLFAEAFRDAPSSSSEGTPTPASRKAASRPAGPSCPTKLPGNTPKLRPLSTAGGSDCSGESNRPRVGRPTPPTTQSASRNRTARPRPATSARDDSIAP